MSTVLEFTEAPISHHQAPSDTITTTQPEATLRELLALDQSLHSIEVQSPALKDAFLALTSNA